MRRILKRVRDWLGGVGRNPFLFPILYVTMFLGWMIAAMLAEGVPVSLNGIVNP